MKLYLKDRCLAYVKPLWFLAISFYGLIIALFHIASHSPRDLLSVSKVKEAVFAQFWLRVGKTVSVPTYRSLPCGSFMILALGPAIVEGETDTAIPALVSEASGVILELGPGIGNQLPRYDVSKITKVYGVEPNRALHGSLREKIKACGLTDVYEIVPCGVEDIGELEKHGIVFNSIDTILSIQVLCSVPDLEKTLRRLYDLMKPGGQLTLYEHVKSTDVVSAIVQNQYNLVWPFFLGNCNLNRDILHCIKQAGDWEKTELRVPTSEDAWNVLPRIYGRLWKKQ